MLINALWKLLLILTASSLIIYALTPEASLGYLLKLFALNWGVLIVYAIAWPHIRGVRKGDPIVVRGEPIAFFFTFPNAIAMSNGRLNGYVELKLMDGSFGIGKVVRYQGILSHAEVELLEQHATEIHITKLK